MTISMTLGIFTLGFVLAAVLLYGPMMAKAYWVRAQAILIMKGGNQKLRESTEKEKEYAGLAQEVNEALKKELEAKTELLNVAAEYGQLQEKYLAVLDVQAALLKQLVKTNEDYAALHKKVGGNAEGTA